MVNFVLQEVYLKHKIWFEITKFIFFLVEQFNKLLTLTKIALIFTV